MKFDRQEMIEWLKLEIEFLERGGYYPSVRDPRQEPRIFRDSVVCLNMGLEEKLEPCSKCFLMEFVPPDRRNEQEPCHYIPLNERGDTVASLAEQDKPAELQAALLSWLRGTVARLNQEIAQERGALCG